MSQEEVLVNLDASVEYCETFFGCKIRVESLHKLENEDIEVGPLPWLGGDSLTFCHPIEAVFLVLHVLRGMVEHPESLRGSNHRGQF